MIFKHPYIIITYKLLKKLLITNMTRIVLPILIFKTIISLRFDIRLIDNLNIFNLNRHLFVNIVIIIICEKRSELDAFIQDFSLYVLLLKYISMRSM